MNQIRHAGCIHRPRSGCASAEAIDLKQASGIVFAICALIWIFAGAAGAYQPFVSQTGQPCNWALDSLPGRTLHWMPAPGVPDMAGDSMACAFQAWRDATDGQFNFVMGAGEITIDWDMDGSKIADPLLLAYTTYNTDSNGHIISANI